MLSDKGIFPTDEYLTSIIGDKMYLWHLLMNFVKDTHPDSTGEWNYYNDGKRWLFKMIKKKKTIFWGGILDDTFRITFYFGDKAESLIQKSELPQSIIDSFGSAKKYGAIRPISIKVSDNSDLDNIKKLITIKLNIK